MTSILDRVAPSRGRRRRGPPRRRTSLTVAAAIALTQALAPVARAQDVTPPSIDHDPVRELPAGGTADVEASVTDDTGVSGVTLHLGLGDEDFREFAMENESGSRYLGTLPADGLVEGDSLRYYISAEDAAGNEQLRGFPFDPLVVTVGPADAGGDAIASAEPQSRTLWYLVGGALVLGVVAAAAGGGSSGGGGVDSGSATSTLGQTILVQ